MVFSSLLFLGIFLPIVLILYNISKNLKYRNIILVISSLIFYAWGEPKLIILLLLTAFVGWAAGLALNRYPKGSWQSKVALIGALVLCLGSLGVFKYSGFVVENISRIIGIDIGFAGFALPLGISLPVPPRCKSGGTEHPTILFIQFIRAGTSKPALFVSQYMQLAAMADAASYVIRCSCLQWAMQLAA